MISFTRSTLNKEGSAIKTHKAISSTFMLNKLQLAKVKIISSALKMLCKCQSFSKQNFMKFKEFWRILTPQNALPGAFWQHQNPLLARFGTTFFHQKPSYAGCRKIQTPVYTGKTQKSKQTRFIFQQNHQFKSYLQKTYAQKKDCEFPQPSIFIKVLN